MNLLELMLTRNRNWSQQLTLNDPLYFERLTQNQTPGTLWIGCSDSRVPPELMTQAAPGEIFVHRNVANLVDIHDDNTMSVVQYALEHLQISCVVICGHYGCGGVDYAQCLTTESLEDADRQNYVYRRLAPLGEMFRHTIKTHPDLMTLSPEHQHQTLVELNVTRQIQTLSQIPLVQDALRQNASLTLNGCVYDMRDGKVHLLHTVSGDVSDRGYIS